MIIRDLQRAFLASSAFAFVLLSSPADATIINYSVDGAGPFTLNADTVTLGAFSGSIDLLDGVPQVAKINSLFFDVQFGPLGSNTFNISRLMSIGTNSETIAQLGSLNLTTFADYLSLDGGAPVTFDFGSYVIDVTPLAAGTFERTSIGTTEYQVDAEFLLRSRSVPESGSSALMLGLSLLGMTGITRVLRGAKR